MAKKEQLERFVIEKISRSSIHEAEYNPRKISPAAKAKLKKDISRMGMLQPIVVNKTTWNIVAGHQRVQILDQIHGGKDYEMSAAIVELSEKDEVKANLLLNNQSVMGEWDPQKLADLSALDIDIDLINDAGFTQMDLDLIFSGDQDIIQSLTPHQDERKSQKKELLDAKMKSARKDQIEKSKQESSDGLADQFVDKDDYMLTFVFDDNTQKKKALLSLNWKAQRGRYLPGHILEGLLSIAESTPSKTKTLIKAGARA
jgi:ParB-like chromosome segregation protein Spo0J